MKTPKQRSDYIRSKGRQLDNINNVDRRIRRLSRIMAYHLMLTRLEMAAVHDCVNNIKKNRGEI